MQVRKKALREKETAKGFRASKWQKESKAGITSLAALKGFPGRGGGRGGQRKLLTRALPRRSW